MPKTNKVYIDKDRLQKALKRRKIKCDRASVDMGYSHSTISRWCSKGFMPKSATQLLESLFGIYPEEYVIQNIQNEPETQIEIPLINEDNSKKTESEPSEFLIKQIDPITITIEFSDETLERIGKMLTEAIWNAGVNLK